MPPRATSTAPTVFFIKYLNGGKKSKNLFLDEHDVFLDETLDIFVFGDMTKHKSRDDALDSVIDITNMSEKELNLHFKAEDNLGGYT